MTKNELIAKLAKFPGSAEVMILDGFNGGGHPAAINLGPYTHTINEGNQHWSADCEDRVGEEVIVIGFGSY